MLRRLAEQRESWIEEGHLMPDHVHMMISIPPKHAVLQVIGYIKGKSAIYIARRYSERKRNFVGQQFWDRGYFVSTMGRSIGSINAITQSCKPSRQRTVLVRPNTYRCRHRSVYAVCAETLHISAPVTPPGESASASDEPDTANPDRTTIGTPAGHCRVRRISRTPF